MNKERSLSIVVAEDNPRDREFLASTMSDYDLHIARDGREALELVNSTDISCIVSDLQMPELNGVELGKKIWQQKPHARIVFWSQYHDEVYLRALTRIIPPETVYGYVLKSNTSQVLRQAIDFVFVADQCWIDPKVRSVQARGTPSSEHISEAEYEVLFDIALGLTDNMIARRRYLTRRGVQSRLKLLYQKLGVDRATIHDEQLDAFNPRARAVSIALQRGLIKEDELKKAEKQLAQWLETQTR